VIVVAKAFIVSENIGFDGKHYYCLHCGRSGYESMPQAKGHLGKCTKKTPKPRGFPLNSVVREMTGTFEDDDGDQYRFSLRVWPI
jgi:hypothetical protein